MIDLRGSLTSLLVGAGVAMVAMTSLATVVMTIALQWSKGESLENFLLMIACSGTATIFVFSHLHLELKTREKESFAEARTDALTGAANRKALIEALEQRNSRHRTDVSTSCLVFLDLNDFKNVNDTLGHEIGDELLVQVTQRLLANLDSHPLYRLGGDEFAIILQDCGLKEAEDTCRKLYGKIIGTYPLGETRAAIGCSMGIAEFEAGLNASALMRRADLAMYKAKKSRTFVEIFDQSMIDEVVRRSKLSDSLRLALEDGTNIALKYQPIFSRSKQVVALEVFFRWHDEEFGAVPPREAVQIARLTQQIDNLSLYVADMACRVINRIPGIRMCINLEAMQILDTRFSEALEELIARKGLCNSNFELEIDEAEIVAYGSKIAPVMRGLADSGFSLAVDNFGSSTSSITELKSLGVTALKLDDSVLHNARETGNIAILRAKVNLAATLGMKVTCKGIGDTEDEAIALQAGCDYLQGFKYGRPDNAEVFADQDKDVALRAAG